MHDHDSTDICFFKKRKFVATQSQMQAIFSFIREMIARVSFDPSAKKKIELALEEVIVNIIQYAYPNHEGNIEMHIEYIKGKKLRFYVKDWGIPFNPLQNLLFPNCHESLEERQEGGLGLFFIQQFMDHVSYERKHKTNLLILEKRETHS